LSSIDLNVARPRLTLIFAAESPVPWMNLVERWFSALTTKQLQRGAHNTVAELVADIEAWVDVWNNDPKPFIWHKTADQILDKLAGCCTAITEDTNRTEPA